MKLKLTLTLAALSGLACVLPIGARDNQVGVKTNLLYDATLTVNAGIETSIAPKWSLDLSGNFNAWTLNDGKRWKHWMAQPEARYWLCEALHGHFFGIEAHGGQYNIGGTNADFTILGTDFGKLKHSRYRGWFIGAGVTYGYTWMLGRHWNLEAEIGFGYSYTRFDRYPCANCGTKLESDKTHHYVGPTKAALNLVYVF